MNKIQERRAAFRMDVVSRAMCRLSSPDGTISGPIRDISIAGLYMQTDERPAVNSRFGVEIVLKGKHSEMVIGSMSAMVIRHDEIGVAVRFEERFEWFAMVPLYFNTVPATPL